MKYVAGKIFAILVGILAGFFGVFNSVFSDSNGLSERLITISAVLIIYVILSAILGYLLPKTSWKWGLFLSLPGAFFLLFYMFSEFNPYYILYVILLITVSCIGGYIGTKFRKKNGRKVAFLF